MHLKLALSIFFVALLSLSCKKSGTEEEPGQKQKKILSRIIETSIAQAGNTTVFTNFTYDEAGRLIKEKNPASETNYTYKQDEVFQVIQQTEFAKITIDFTYESGRIKKASVADKRGALVNQFDLKYSYQGYKLLRIDRVSDGIVSGKTEYQYKGEEVSKTIADDGTNIITIDYTSDDKKNLHYDLGRQVIDVMASLRSKASSLHNFVTEKTTFTLHEGPATSSLDVSYEYKYDEDGYPVTLIRKSKHSSQTVGTESRSTFEYKTVTTTAK
ncbi:hypothetical protein [Pedobacter sp. GR22-6]|uniref:hypothetical protein n=1 Tax=Pedobacter sp. GR22-6 TaxID=3127957 RepID=UPI00307D0FAA